METESAKYLAAALSMGIGSIGSAIAQGYIGGKAMEGMSRNPQMTDKLFTNMLVADAVAESQSIYALVIALIILFV